MVSISLPHLTVYPLSIFLSGFLGALLYNVTPILIFLWCNILPYQSRRSWSQSCEEMSFLGVITLIELLIVYVYVQAVSWSLEFRLDE